MASRAAVRLQLLRIAIMYVEGLEKPRFLKKFSGFKVFLGFNVGYKDRTQNYDTEIHEEYLIHDTPIPLPHHL